MAEDLDVVKSGLLMSSNLGTRCDEPTRWNGREVFGVEEAHNDFALKRKLTAAWRRTDLKFARNYIFGWNEVVVKSGWFN